MFEGFVVKISSNYGSGEIRDIAVDKITTPRQVLEPFEVLHEADYLIKANKVTIGLDYVLQPNDIVIITPSHIEGAVSVPKMRRFKKFLRANGYIPLAGTATDHENWQSPLGVSLKVNAANHNRSEVDLASLKACAALEGISPHTLHERIDRA